jgi:hypothetical protein
MEMRNAYNILGGKPEGRKPLGRPRHRWEEISKWALGEKGGSGLINLSSRQGPVVGSCEHGKEPTGSIKGMELLSSLYPCS